MKKRKFEDGGIVDNIEREAYLEDTDGNPVISGFEEKIKVAGRAPAPIERKDPATGLKIASVGDAPIVRKDPETGLEIASLGDAPIRPAKPPIKPLPKIAAGPPPQGDVKAPPSPVKVSAVRPPDIERGQRLGAASANEPREVVARMPYMQFPVGEPPPQDGKRKKLSRGRKGPPKKADGKELIPGLSRRFPGMKEGGSVTRGDGIAQRGKTKGRYI